MLKQPVLSLNVGYYKIRLRVAGDDNADGN